MAHVCFQRQRESAHVRHERVPSVGSVPVFYGHSTGTLPASDSDLADLRLAFYVDSRSTILLRSVTASSSLNEAWKGTEGEKSLKGATKIATVATTRFSSHDNHLCRGQASPECIHIAHQSFRARAEASQRRMDSWRNVSALSVISPDRASSINRLRCQRPCEPVINEAKLD